MDITLLIKLLKKIQNDDVFSISAQFSYYITMGLLPFITLCIIVMQYYSASIYEGLKIVKNILPNEVYSLLYSVIKSSVDNYQSSYIPISIIILLWSASSSSLGIIKGINQAYDCKLGNNYVLTRILSIIFTLGLTLSFQIVFASILIGEHILKLLSNLLDISQFFLTIYKLIVLVFPILLLFLMITLVYKLAPNKKIKYFSTFPGAILTTVGCIISSIGFSYYISYRLSYFKSIYGNLSGVFILLLWIYMNSFIFLVGAELNGFLLIEKIPFKKIFHIK